MAVNKTIPINGIFVTEIMLLQGYCWREKENCYLHSYIDMDLTNQATENYYGHITSEVYTFKKMYFKLKGHASFSDKFS
jgi:hypothetical protein